MRLLKAVTLKQPFATLSALKEHTAEGRNSVVLPADGGHLWVTSSQERWKTYSSAYVRNLKERLLKWSSTPARAHAIRTYLGCEVEELTPKIAEDKFPRGRLVGEVVLGQMQEGTDLTDNQYRYAYPIHEAREFLRNKQIFMQGSQGTWLAPEVLLRAIHENGHGVQDSTKTRKRVAFADDVEMDTATQISKTVERDTATQISKTRKRLAFADDLGNSWKTRRLRSAHAQSNDQSSTFDWPDPPKVSGVRNRRRLARAKRLCASDGATALPSSQ